MNKNFKKVLGDVKCNKITRDNVLEYVEDYRQTHRDEVFGSIAIYFSKTFEYVIKVRLKIVNEYDVEYLYQEGLIGLLGAINSFVDGNFTTYATTFITTQIINSCKSKIYNQGMLKRSQGELLFQLKNKKELTDTETLKLNKLKMMANANNNNNDDDISFIDTLSIEELKQCLTTKEYNIIYAIYFGYTRKEICEQLNISKQALSVQIRAIRGKVGNYIA